MSKDIRSYFMMGGSKPKPPSKPANADSPSPSEKPKATKKRKQLIILDSDDSDDDDFVQKKTKPTSSKTSKSPEKKVVEEKKSTLVPVSSVADILGSKPAKRSLIATLPEKEKKKEEVAPKKAKKLEKKGKVKSKTSEVANLSDSDFEATLEQLDEIDALEKQVLEAERAKEKITKISPPKTNGSNHASTSKSLPTESKSPPRDTKSPPKGTKSKYFASSATEKILEDYKHMQAEAEKRSNTKSEKRAASPDKNKEKHASPPKHKEKNKRESSVEKKKRGESPEHKAKVREKAGASASKVHDSGDEVIEGTPDPLERRKQHADSYRKYMQRAGPAHPGSKEIPQGVAHCLQGLTFVVTGVLDSLDREEAAELIRSYGGKATSSVSKNTSYVVAGAEPGPSKMDKAEKLGTPVIDEDGLLDLIRTRQPFAATPSPSSDKQAKKPSLHTTPRAEHKPEPPKPHTKSEKPQERAPSPKKLSPGTPKLKSEAVSSAETTPTMIKKETFYSGSSPVSQTSVASSGAQYSPGLAASQSSAGSSQPPDSPRLAVSCETAGTSMWVDKYKPTSVKQVIGQQGDRSCAVKLRAWLTSWAHNNAPGAARKPKPAPWSKGADDGSAFKAVLLSGPPGIGKTTCAQLVCRELGFDIVEFNASDTRSKKLLQDEVKELLTTQTLSGFITGGSQKALSQKRVLLMEEVDGVAGTQDRGGIPELINLIKKSKVPIICTCNDRAAQKLRSFVNHCFDLRFPKPRLEQIRGAMMSLCFKEKVKIPVEALNAIIEGTNHDIRQVIHHLSLWSAGQSTMDSDLAKKEAGKSRKEIKLGPWDVVRKVFSEEEQQGMNVNQRAALFFHDYSLGPLFVQENYLSAMPHGASRGEGLPRAQVSPRERLRRVADAADSIATSDLVDNMLRGNSAWGLLPTQAVFASVVPGTVLRGHLSGMARFPAWLGKNSRKNKFDRLLSELQMHMRLSISGSKEAVALDYVRAVRDKVQRPVLQSGTEGIAEALEVMDQYHLLREDLDSMNEICAWGVGEVDPWVKLSSQTKAAFTRAYNKASLMTPYSISGAGVKGGRRRGGGDEFDELEDEEGEGGAISGSEEEEDLGTDLMIKAKKPSAAKASTSSGRGTSGGAKTANPRGGGKGGRGRGRGK